ncbi:unnamed protein product [Lymnaea stagnalis]|uniref:Uncharacterized protein n=1 Tax=Lymnaea stagnalis TaxID=6523 RepID=A0AAV2IG50_LYMST
MLSSLFVVVIALGAVAAQTYQAPTYPNPGNQAKPQASNPPASNPPANNPPANNPPASNAPTYKPSAANTPVYNAPGYNAPGYNAPGYNAPGYNAPGYNAPASYPKPSYNNGQVYAGRNVNAEVEEARRRIGDLEQYVITLSGVADDVTSKVKLVTAFAAEFQNKIYPTIQDYSKAQDKKIASFRAQIEELRTLQDDVAELSSKVDDIAKTLAANRERRSVIAGEISRLDDTDVAQNLAIGKLETLVKSEGDRLAEAANKVNNNKAKASDISDNLDKAVKVFNYEQGTSFTVTVSSAKPSVVYTFTSAFPAVPDVQWGIIGATIEDLPSGNDYKADKSYGSQGNYKSDNSYGSQGNYNDESINGRVNVTASATGATVSLVDNSDGFQISSFRVRVTATLIDSGYLEYTSKATTYY